MKRLIMLVSAVVAAVAMFAPASANAANVNITLSCTQNETTNLGNLQTNDTITVTSYGSCAKSGPSFLWNDGGSGAWFTTSPTLGSASALPAAPLVITIDPSAPQGSLLTIGFTDSAGSLTHRFNLGVVAPGPDAPTNLSATPRNAAILVSFTPSANTYCGSFGRYEYSTDNGATWKNVTEDDGNTTDITSPVRLRDESGAATRLVNGTAYQVQIRGVDSCTTPGPAATVGTVTPTQTPPGAPTGLVATVLNQGADIAFTAPADDGGTPITNYEYSIDGGTNWVTPSPAVTTSPLTITGLTNGTAYSIKLRAVNAIGQGDPSTTTLSVTPALVPAAAPTSVQVTAGDQQLSVAFTAPANFYGSALQTYEYSLDGGTTWVTPTPAVTASPITITGLTNGTTYAVVVRARTDVAGNASSTEPATPVGTPVPPSNLTVTPGDRTLTVALTDVQLNGNMFNGYQYSTDNGLSWWMMDCNDPVMFMPTLPCPAAGLVLSRESGPTPPFPPNQLSNGTTYDVLVRAMYQAPGGMMTSFTAAAGPVQATPAAAPAAPTGLSVTNGNGEATVAFTAGSNGGAAITTYEYSIDGGTSWVTPNPAVTASPITITGLTNGQTYSVALRAVNAVGPGTASSTATASPQAVAPAVPATVSVTPADQGATVTFTAGSNGGSPITNYEYSTDGGTNWVTPNPAVTTSPLSITGLTNGQAYSVVVRAVNVIGPGPATVAQSVTPAGAPLAPTGVSAAPGQGSATITFTAAAGNGATVTNYEYSTDGGTNWVTPNPAVTTSPLTITGLTAGTTYALSIRAVNSVGPGASASAGSVTPVAGAPSAPAGITITPGNESLVVSITAGSANGAAITDYEYSTDGGTTWTSAGTATGPFTITGLTGGTSYTVQVRAVNSVGPGTGTSATGTPATTPSPAAPSPTPSPGATPAPIGSFPAAPGGSPGAGSSASGSSGSGGSGSGSTTRPPRTGGGAAPPGGSTRFSTRRPAPWGARPTRSQAQAALSGPLAPVIATPMAPGQGLASTAGRQEQVEVDPQRPARSVAVRLRGWTTTLQAVDEDGRRFRLGPSGQLVLEPLVGLRVTGRGYAADSDVNIYMRSTPTFMGTARTNSRGEFTTVVQVPPAIAAGSHNVEATGLTEEGDVRSMAYGVQVRRATRATVRRATILFAPDQHAPGARARQQLTRLARAIPARASKVTVSVRGSSFRVGTAQKARAFSRKRAIATIAWLKRTGPRADFVARWTVPPPVERPSIRSAVVTVSYVVRRGL